MIDLEYVGVRGWGGSSLLDQVIFSLSYRASAS
jgi:hypothetical protein